MPIRIEPEPTDSEREAILAALAAAAEDASEWVDAALLESVESDEFEP